ncbi:MAG: hypothetical protein H6558_02935 [Lewinellaceae bacterium]|nr:hypothetical protein [Lewinellaceae bacterium]
MGCGVPPEFSARKVAYGEDIVYSVPVYESMVVEGDKVRISFSSLGSGLMTKNKYGYVTGFAIAGVDKQFHWAKAYIDGETVVVCNPEVKTPVVFAMPGRITPGH